MQTKNKTFLIGSYGRGNIGDDAFLLVAKNLFKNHDLYCNYTDDEHNDTSLIEDITTVKTKFVQDLPAKIKLFFQIDNIVYFGGDLWAELKGEVFPRSPLYKMIFVNVMAKIFNKRIYYIGCGVGEIGRYSKILTKISSNISDGVIVRDERSKRLIGKSSTLLPDLTINLNHPKPNTFTNDKLNIGISVLYNIDNPDKNFDNMIINISNAISKLDPSKIHITLIPMLVSSNHSKDDMWACKQLSALLKGYSVSIFDERSVKSLMECCSKQNIVVAARLHASILSILSGTPTIGISYRKKVANFYKDAGLEDFCIEMSQLDKLGSKLYGAIDDIDYVRQRFRKSRDNLTSKRKDYEAFIIKNF